MVGNTSKLDDIALVQNFGPIGYVHVSCVPSGFSCCRPGRQYESAANHPNHYFSWNAAIAVAFLEIVYAHS